jgi:hypothetical protein
MTSQQDEHRSTDGDDAVIVVSGDGDSDITSQIEQPQLSSPGDAAQTETLA